jgi:hypothetical protein
MTPAMLSISRRMQELQERADEGRFQALLQKHGRTI